MNIWIFFLLMPLKCAVKLCVFIIAAHSSLLIKSAFSSINHRCFFLVDQIHGTKQKSQWTEVLTIKKTSVKKNPLDMNAPILLPIAKQTETKTDQKQKSIHKTTEVTIVCIATNEKRRNIFYSHRVMIMTNSRHCFIKCFQLRQYSQIRWFNLNE